MAAETAAGRLDHIDTGKWLTGASAGVVATLVMLVAHVGLGVVDPADVTAVPVAGNLLIGAAIGLVYAGIASVDRLAALASDPRTGVVLGVAFALVLWAITAADGPLASALTVGELLPRVLAGAAIGLIYAVSPYRT